MSADYLGLLTSFAAGVNALAGITLLVLYARSRPARWFALFSLVLAGLFLAWGTAWPGVVQLAHAAPAAFVGFAVSTRKEWPSWSALAAFAMMWAVLEAVHGAPFALLVTIGVWSAGTLQLMRCSMPAALVGRSDLRRRTVFRTLMVVPFIAVASGVLLDEYSVLLLVPLTVLAQALGLYAAVRFRMYEATRRHERSERLAVHAVENDRSRVVGEVGAMLAHEVRNPLTGIRSLTEQLGDAAVDDETRSRYTELILKEVDRLETLVKEVLERSKRGAGPATGETESDIASLFSDLDALLSPGAAERQVRLVWSTKASPVATSPSALGQALLNLVTNAIGHSPKGGVVTVAAHRSGQAVEISIRDQGPGIPVGLGEQVFQPFFSQSGGTGLGLAVVRSLAEDHGWDVFANNLESGGAEFLIRIPDAASASVPATRRLVSIP